MGKKIKLNQKSLTNLCIKQPQNLALQRCLYFQVFESLSLDLGVAEPE